MDYHIKEVSIGDLVKLIDDDKVDLSPSYQRNFIWSKRDQSELVDTIIKGYPLPNFFMFEKPSGKFEMVDGQQRSQTIYRFIKGSISASKEFDKASINDLEKEKILKYRLSFVIIKNLRGDDSLNEFYVLINKKGKHLNVPEVNKSEFHDSAFLRLAEDALSYQGFINLNLFSEATSKRMNDRAFAEELLAYLKYGVSEKRNAVDKVYIEDNLRTDEYNSLLDKFKAITDKICLCNDFFPIQRTRYKQKNDFFTLFNFFEKNMNHSDEQFIYWYKLLLIINLNDSTGNQLIRPSNEECEQLRLYAINCVSQSNSKRARESRLKFFNEYLKNSSSEGNDVLNDIRNYLAEKFDEDKTNLVAIGNYYLLDATMWESQIKDKFNN